jgi:hypothetical protein
MAITKKDKQIEHVTLTFDWAEGALELPRIDKLPAVKVSEAVRCGSPGHIISILADFISEDDIDFLLSLDDREIGEVFEKWSNQTQALMELDEGPAKEGREISLEEILGLNSDEPAGDILPGEGEDWAVTDAHRARHEKYLESPEGKFFLQIAEAIGGDPREDDAVRAVIESLHLKGEL